MSDLITLHQFMMTAEAEVFKSILESQGIPSYIQDQNTNYIIGATILDGNRLQVREEDFEKAKKILDNYLQNQD